MYQAGLKRLKACMQRASHGEELVIAFLGGSITQGSLATKDENTYARRVFSWWKESFPESRFYYVNGGIGGTSSHYGVSRAVTDVLMYQPDFVIVDFSVNDEPGDFFKETYEGVIRKLLSWTSKPAVLLLNNVYYDTGSNAQEYHNAVGGWYGIPYISIKDTVYQRMKAGEYTREELTPDGLHPNDFGHKLVAAEIIFFLEQVKNTMDAEYIAGTGEEADMPQALTANAYENAKRLTIREISPELYGFRADTEEKTGHLDHFKNGWIGRNPGDGILFKVKASCIAVQYRKTIHKPACRAELVLDGNSTHAVLLDGNFEEDWGDCLYLQPVLHHGERKIHTVEIRIPMAETGEAAPFYLMSLIIA